MEGKKVISIAIKRVYEKAVASDGHRILIDGLWPRGFSKPDLKIEKWVKGIAPSGELRKWFGHQSARWAKFQQRYGRELETSPRKELLAELVSLARKDKVTLVFAAKDLEHSNAAVLKDFISRLL